MHVLNYNDYKEKIRQTVAESVVLLKNENNVLPIKQDEKVAIFGRAQIDTYYCGTGSGGMVNIPYLVNIASALESKRAVDKTLLGMYKNFIEQNPFDKGNGWAMEPFSQKELELTEEIVKKAAADNDVAVFVIGRSAGEDKDCVPEGGSYYLNDVEKANLLLVCNNFKRVVVLFNVGGIMDMSFVNSCDVSAVLYTWHGGVESGNGYADVLCGDVNPSGALPNVVAKNLEDYPSAKTFGGEIENIYEEDIFVGYRYFETFAKEKVLYPFGSGLSYTNFAIENTALDEKGSELIFNITVKNTGELNGKKIVQLYCTAPIGTLSKAKIVLIGFAKTKLLSPSQSQSLVITVPKKDFSSFDDVKSAFVLERGEYIFSVGFNSRDIDKVGEISLKTDEIIEECTPALYPIKPFKKLGAQCTNAVCTPIYEDAVLRSYNIKERIASELGTADTKTDYGYTFEDVKSGKISAIQLAQDLSDLELIHMSRGEGMCSPKVTPGTAGSFGGVSDTLNQERKMPIACCSDGPSGIRMDCGTMAMSIPNATAIASTFNTQIVEELFEHLSLEMVHHKVDTLLGPGMNIHRSPLCGRNFEYYSEDPLLTGKMAVAQLKAMHRYNVTGTIKHFAANNQEKARKTVDAVVSARALREIYLKGFEMAVKDGKAYSVMTAYNPINGTQAASNYDLNTTILRKDWGFDGVVMTDWWATMNKEGGPSDERHTADMIISQNDVFMVCSNAQQNSNGDDSEQALNSGDLTRYPLVRNAANMINNLVRFNCSRPQQKVELLNVPESTFENSIDVGTFHVAQECDINCENIVTKKGTSNIFALNMDERGKYIIEFDMFANAVELAQITLTVKANGAVVKIITLKGGTKSNFTGEFTMFNSINTYIEMFFSESGMEINKIKVKKAE